MNQNYLMGIDLGSQNMKIVLVGYENNETKHKIISKNSYPISGISFGYINNKKDFSKSFNNALNTFYKKTPQASKAKEVFLSIDGDGLSSEYITIIQQLRNRTILSTDIENVQKQAEINLYKKHKKNIIHTETISYILDGFKHFDNPEGLKVKKLETNIFFLTYPENHLSNLEKSINNHDLPIEGYVAAPQAASEIAISTIDKKSGCLLVDYGAEKTTILLIEDNKPIHLQVFKNGSKDITKKIAIEKKISISDAEKIKKNKIKDSVAKKIIKSELNSIAKKINDTLKKWNREKMLPGGIILIGGGAKIDKIEDIFKSKLSLPIKKPFQNMSDEHTDYYTAYGSILFAKNNQDTGNNEILKNIKKIWKTTTKPILKIFKL